MQSSSKKFQLKNFQKKSFTLYLMFTLILFIISIEIVTLISSWHINISSINSKYAAGKIVNNNLSKKCNQEEKDSITKLRCWEDLITTNLKQEGLESTMTLLASLYSEDTDFASQCHQYTHIIGSQAYFIFSQTKEVYTGSKASYCGYGFYHGFMETLINTTNDFSQAREYCQRTAESSKLSSAWTACYHGIGHGVADGSDPSKWGNDEAMINDALTLCDKVSENDIQKESCGSGVFNSLAIMYLNPRYKLIINKNDPFQICYKQKNDYFTRVCFEEMNTLVVRINDGDIYKALKVAANIRDDKYAGFAIKGISTYATAIGATIQDPNKFMEVCHSLRISLQIPCLQGLVGGIIENGQPEKQYLVALDLCQDNMLSSEEKEACFQSILRHGNYFYSDTKYQDLCQIVKNNYKDLCNIKH